VPVQFGGDDSGSYWRQVPTGSDFARVFPPNALEHHIEGRAMLYCQIQDDGHVRCALGEETPQGEGFGNAALALSTRFQLKEEALALPGLTPGERIQIPISFRIG
jgi:hypothetical protein